MEYRKPYRSYDELADMLLQKGLVANKSTLLERLSCVGYYRLCGYWHIFKKTDGMFRDETTLEKIWGLYAFDRQLRLVTLDAIERVEVYLRSQLAHALAEDGGPFGFLEADNLPGFSPKRHSDFIGRCTVAFNRSREPFAIHFREKYGDRHALPPYWMLVNVMDFGTVFSLYRGAPKEIRKKISRSFGVEPTVMDSWLTTLNTTRNICCHHGRLWNRVYGTKPMIPRKKNDIRWHEPYRIRPDNVFAALAILRQLLETAAPDTNWQARLFELLDTRSEAELAMMGFEAGWQECPIWKP